MKGHIQKRGKNSWRLKFDADRDSGTGDRKIQYVTFRGSKREAQNRLAELIASVSTGKYVEPTKVIVSKYVADRINFWEQSKRISARTAERYRFLLTFQISLHVGPMRLQQLKPADIEEWHSQLLRNGHSSRECGVAPRTVRHAHRVLSKALKDATRDDLVPRNVCELVQPPHVHQEDVVICQNVSVLIADLKHWRHGPIGLTALFTGMRLGEVLALRWGRIDLESVEKTIAVREALEVTKAHGIRFKVPKTRAGTRDITLPDLLVELLRDLRRRQTEARLRMGLGKLPDDALVFSDDEGGPLSLNSISAAWAHFAKSSALDGVTFHALRHTHVSLLIDQGVDVVTISRRLGHAKPDITLRIYAHLFQKSDGKAAAAINSALKSST